VDIVLTAAVPQLRDAAAHQMNASRETREVGRKVWTE
jgi:hypothetical protein